MAYSFGIADGTYAGRPTTASCYEKDGRLILDVNFAVRDPETGEWYRKENGYDWEAKKRHWLTSADGAFNEKTIQGIREWAKGWNPRGLEDFWWFQEPGADGTPFGNLAAIGEVSLAFQTDGEGNQNLWVHAPGAQKGGGRKAWAPPEAVTDRAAIAARWGARAKALFAAAPKAVGAARGEARGTRGATPPHPETMATPPPETMAAPPPETMGATPPGENEAAKPWDKYPKTCDGAFEYYCALLDEPYSSAKHDAEWFRLFDEAARGKDPDQFAPGDVRRLFETIERAMDAPPF